MTRPAAGLPPRAAQLTLAFGEVQAPSFELYVPGSNTEVYEHLRTLARGEGSAFTYLYGDRASGKTHLLRACCEAHARCGRPAAYLLLAAGPAGALADVDTHSELELVCLDDVQAVAGDAEAERTMLRLYEGLRGRGRRLVCAGNAPPSALGIALRDLESRLGWGLVFHLQTLRDRDKILMLRRRSEARGYELPPGTAEYLLARCPRDLGTLCELLDRLEDLSLRTHRRLTVPLMRAVLENYRTQGDR